MTRHIRATTAQDQNVLTIFLPILAVALVACAGACYYRERKRKKKLKMGVQPQEEHFSDTDSIAASISSRHRPYMLPTPTTGRVFRSSSRAGSVKGAYDLDSSYGEPPPYSGKVSRRSSIASIKALHEDNNYQSRGIPNDGYAASQTSLNRSRSMLDVREAMGEAPLSRSLSSTSLRSSQRDKWSPEVALSRRDDDASSQRSRPRSPAMSDWSTRTAPQITAYEHEYSSGRPSSVASLPVRGRRSNMRRSLSQPDLSISRASKSGTYPQGILKRQNYEKYGMNHQENDADYGAKIPSTQMDDRRFVRQPPHAYGVQRGQWDNQYSHRAGNYSTYPSMPHHGTYNESVYSASSGAPYHHARTPARNWINHPSNGYDPYAYGRNHLGPRNNRARIQAQVLQDPYAYHGSTMY